MASKKSENGDFLAGVLATYLRSSADEDKSKVSSQVLVTTEDNTLIWSEREKQILVIPTKALLVPCEGASAFKPAFQVELYCFGKKLQFIPFLVCYFVIMKSYNGNPMLGKLRVICTQGAELVVRFYHPRFETL